MKMAIDTTYTDARENLAKLLDRVTGDREVVFIRRRGQEKVALVAADELEGLMETAHLLRSPRNATRLLTALRRALRGGGEPESVTRLRRDLGLGGVE
jgi:antitoxin YefM